jgi:antitoxin ParD1/3/4
LEDEVPTMNVSLTPELEKFIHDKVATGRYQTASEVVREALRALDDAHARELEIQRIREHIAKGVAEADAGVLFEPEEVWEYLNARIDEIESQRNKARVSADSEPQYKEMKSA